MEAKNVARFESIGHTRIGDTTSGRPNRTPRIYGIIVILVLHRFGSTYGQMMTITAFYTIRKYMLCGKRKIVDFAAAELKIN